MFYITPDPSDHPLRKNPEYVKTTYYGVINVSDTPCMTFEYQNAGIRSLWFPIHEVGTWGYSPFYGTAKFLDQKLASGDSRPILLHCHAGANRSQCIGYAILQSMDISDTSINAKLDMGEGVPNLFWINLNKGYIPDDIIPFLKARLEHPNYGIIELLRVISSKHIRYVKPNTPALTFNGVPL